MRGFASAASILVATTFSMSAVAQTGHTQDTEPTEAAPFGAPVDDQHVWFHAMLDQFEGRFGSESSLRWDGEAWTGTDTHRLWLKSEGALTKSKVGDSQQEAYYSTPISTYFDLQVGGRYDLDDRSGRGWGAIGVEGLAPLFFRVAATAYASNQGHFAAKFVGNYDLLITQQLILQPMVEVNFYTKSEASRGVGSGLSDLDVGLRLRYEISRKFAPYVGVTYEKKFGQTGKFAAASGENTDALRVAVGVRAWY